MDKNLNNIFKKAIYTPEYTLPEVIWNKIILKQRRNNTLFMLSYSLVGIFSLLGLISTVKDTFIKFSQSGFYEYLSLISSDGGYIIKYWKEFSLSITESLPLTSMIVSLFLLFIIVVSTKRLFYQYRGQLLMS